MEKPDVVPDKLKNPINGFILALIIGGTIAFHVFMSVSNQDQTDEIISIVSFINPLAASIASFVIGKRYVGTNVFGKAYISLGFAYLAIFFAEVTYLIYDLFLGIEPYPSIADVFFFALYPLTMIHLIYNIKFFKTKTSKLTISWMILIPAGLIGFYALASFGELEEVNFDFMYGLIFVSGASITLVFSILGAKIFRQGLLGTPWLLLVIGILSLTAGDVWYYYLEILGNYELTHPVNLFWYAGYWIVVYALYKHKTVI